MSDREQFTIRVPEGTMNRVREESRAYGESINDLILSSLEKELARRERVRVLERIDRRRRELAAARGPHGDSTLLVRRLRSGGDRREDEGSSQEERADERR